MPRFTIKEKCSEYKFDNGIWKAPTLIRPDGYHKYGEILLKAMKENANFVGMIDLQTGTEDSYGCMAEKCIRCALWLKKQGVKPGDVVSISTSGHLNSVIPFVSVLMIGSILNSWWQNFDKDMALHFLKTVQPKILFVEKDNAEDVKSIIEEFELNVLLVSFQKVAGFLFFDEILADQDAEQVANFECEDIKSPEQPAAIMFTSGTTDMPKGAVLSYGTLADTEVFVPAKLISKTSGANGYIFSSNAGLNCYFTAIRAAATMILNMPSIGPQYFRLIEKYRVT